MFQWRATISKIISKNDSGVSQTFKELCLHWDASAWEINFYPVRVLGGVAFSLYGCQTPAQLETGIGGVKSPKIRGGVKILNFQGPLNLTLFYRDSIDIRQFGGQKSKFSRGNFRGEFPPPLAFGTF